VSVAGAAEQNVRVFMLRLLFVFFIIGVAMASQASAAENILKVRVASSGAVNLNGRSVDRTTLETELRKAKASKGVVWYYRENPGGEPTPQVLEVFEILVKHEMPISISSKPDFSDYIDENGYSKPRKQKP